MVAMTGEQTEPGPRPSWSGPCPRAARWQWLSNKWMALAGSMWVLTSTGIMYDFSIYSSALKAVLGFTQSQINLVATSSDTGGSLGVAAGLLSLYLPPWGMLLCGGVLNVVGYGVLWLVASGSIAPMPLWKTCAFMFIGASSNTFFQTITLLVGMENFPAARGMVVGLLKGVVGLGGAIYSQLYSAFFAPDQQGFLLLAAVGPTAVAGLATSVLRYYRPRTDPRDASYLYFFFLVSFGLAAYILLDILISILRPLTAAEDKVMALGLLLILALPLAVPLGLYPGSASSDGSGAVPGVHSGLDDVCPADRMEAAVIKIRRDGHRAGDETLGEKSSGVQKNSRPGRTKSADPEAGLGGGPHGGEEGSWEGQPRVPKENQAHPGKVVSAARTPETRLGASEPKLVPANSSPVEATVGRGQSGNLTSLKVAQADEEDGTFKSNQVSVNPLALEGEDGKPGPGSPSPGLWTTLRVILSSVDFWLLFGVMVAGAGTEMAVSDNLAQIGEAQGYTSTETAASLMNIWSFMGRVLGGFCSEHLMRTYGLPRPAMLAVCQGLMVIGYLYFAIAAPGSMYIATLLVGFGMGVTYSIVTTTASEVFGLASFGLVYNLLMCAIPISSFFFSTVLAGSVYDRQLLLELILGPAALPVRQGTVLDATVCYGARCFSLTFLVLALVSTMGTVANCVLVQRTRKLYTDLLNRG